MKNSQAMLLCASLAAACAHAEAPGEGAQTGAPASVFGELPAQRLRSGQCALVLWSRQSPPQRFLMTLDAPAVARAQIGGTPMELGRVAKEGAPLYGQFPHQRYEGSGVSLSVRFSPMEMSPLSGGALVSSAVVEYSDAEGWTVIIPAAGLIACQA